MSDEARQIMHNAAVVPGYHGTTTAEVVDEVMSACGGQVFCKGSLREFVFERVTEKTYKFRTEAWDAKTYGKN